MRSVLLAPQEKKRSDTDSTGMCESWHGRTQQRCHGHKELAGTFEPCIRPGTRLTHLLSAHWLLLILPLVLVLLLLLLLRCFFVVVGAAQFVCDHVAGHVALWSAQTETGIVFSGSCPYHVRLNRSSFSTLPSSPMIPFTIATPCHCQLSTFPLTTSLSAKWH